MLQIIDEPLPNSPLTAHLLVAKSLSLSVTPSLSLSVAQSPPRPIAYVAPQPSLPAKSDKQRLCNVVVLTI